MHEIMATAEPHGYLYLLQLSSPTGELSICRAGCCDDILHLLRENEEGSRLLYCEAVPLRDAAHLEAEVLCRLRASSGSRLGPTEALSGDPLEMLDAVRATARDACADPLLAAATRRRTRLEPAEYEALLGRFLRDQEADLQGRLVPLPELEQAFEAWQAGMEEVAGGRVPLLRDPFMKACREFGAAANEQVAVRFRARGEDSMLDAARHFRWFVKKQ